MSTDIVKFDRFDGGSFKRWQKKIQFLLGTLNVAYVLTKPYPKESKDETLVASSERLKFKNDNFICRGHILNAMSDLLFDLYEALADHLTDIVANAVICFRKPEEQIDLFMVEIMHMRHKFDADTRLVEGLVLDHGSRHPEMKRRAENCYKLT
nr:T-complex protein 1 subunit zeta 1-like [Tanacetum cinerariifolium]